MVTYTLTPWTVDENGNNACPGTPIDVDVWVEPTVTIAATGDTICDGGTTAIPVTSTNTTTSWHTVYLDSNRQREYCGRIRQRRQRE